MYIVEMKGTLYGPFGSYDKAEIWSQKAWPKFWKASHIVYVYTVANK